MMNDTNLEYYIADFLDSILKEYPEIIRFTPELSFAKAARFNINNFILYYKDRTNISLDISNSVYKKLFISAVLKRKDSLCLNQYYSHEKKVSSILHSILFSDNFIKNNNWRLGLDIINASAEINLFFIDNNISGYLNLKHSKTRNFLKRVAVENPTITLSLKQQYINAKKELLKQEKSLDLIFKAKSGLEITDSDKLLFEMGYNEQRI